jgi:preprotein translocase subunit SecF
MIKFYNHKNYKKMYIIPLILMLLFIFLIFFNPGIHRGLDLRGGNQIIVRYDEYKDYSNIESKFTEQFNLTEVYVNEIKSPTEYGLLIEFSNQEAIEQAKTNRNTIDFVNLSIDDLKTKSKEVLYPLRDTGFLSDYDISQIDDILSKEDLKNYVSETIVLANNNFSAQVVDILKEELNIQEDARIQMREVAATLGSDFYKSSTRVGIIAFILLIIVILLFFKEIIPSGLIIFSSIFDIFAALAGMAIFGLPLNLTTIPALLMLIGYSVDTDILLSTKLLKEKRDPVSAANVSMRTGLTMTLTTICTIVVMLIISYYTQMIVIFEIATVLLCGLFGDLIATWLFNAPALITYVNHKNARKR